MTDDELFREALNAQPSEVEVPDGFADRVVASLAPAAPPRPVRYRLAAVSALAACAIGALAWQTRPHSGEVRVALTESAARQVWLGSRAKVVAEPGTTLRYRVGGWFPSHPDRVELVAGSAFFRVERGGAFEVHTLHGTVSVTGTCFQVSADGGGEAMTTAMRARWFGAGATSVALAVMVYEGGVTLGATPRGPRTALGPGQTAVVLRDGTVARRDPRAPADPVGASQTAAAVASATDARPSGGSTPTEREVERLRGILTAHHLSPETGELMGSSTVRRGLESDGDTDLTPEEWRTLAQRGELRFSLPGSGGRDPDGRIAHQAQEIGLREHEVTAVRDVFRRAQERLTGELRALYREAAGTDPGTMSLDAMQFEIRDKTPGDAVARIDWQLAQERGGLAARGPAGPDALPYERMMRALVGYEGRLDAELTALVGASDARDLLHGPNNVGRHSYGRTSRFGDAGR